MFHQPSVLVLFAEGVAIVQHRIRIQGDPRFVAVIRQSIHLLVITTPRALLRKI